MIFKTTTRVVTESKHIPKEIKVIRSFFLLASSKCVLLVNLVRIIPNIEQNDSIQIIIRIVPHHGLS